MNKTKWGVFVGRFQPFHDGHHAIIKKMNEMHDNILIMVGSAQEEGTIRNPFDYDHRKHLLKKGLDWDNRFSHTSGATPASLHIVPLNDLTDETDNSYEWGQYIEGEVKKHIGALDFESDSVTMHYSDEMTIIGKWFDWRKTNFEFFIHNRNHYQNGLSATDIRAEMLSELQKGAYHGILIKGVSYNVEKAIKRDGDYYQEQLEKSLKAKEKTNE